MSQKLTKEREAQIRETAAAASTSLEDGYADLNALLAELDRIRPVWAPVTEGSHRAGFIYEVAGLTENSPRPVWLGKGKYDERSNLWIEADENRPFPPTTTITHYERRRSPIETIGQPVIE